MSASRLVCLILAAVAGAACGKSDSGRGGGAGLAAADAGGGGGADAAVVEEAPRPDAGAAGPVPIPPPVDDQAPWKYPPLQTSLPEYELRMTDAELANFYANPLTPEIPATFIAGGSSYPAMVRLRGASALYFPKKSWNIDLEAGRFDNRRRFNLVAEYQDQTLMVEKLAYDLLAAMGVPAPRATYVRLKVNGKYEGVFLDLEQVDKHFTALHGGFLDPDPTIYRCGWKDCEMKTWEVPYQGSWSKKSNETEPQTDIQELMEVFNHTPEPDFESVVGARFELRRYLRAMAMDVLISNNFIEDSESYMIHDRRLGKWSYVPWDLNNADPRWWHGYPVEDVSRPAYDHTLFPFTLTDQVVESRYEKRSPLYEGYLPVFSNLGTRVVFNPGLRSQLEALIARGKAELFTEEIAHARIDAMFELIAPHMLGPDSEHTDPYFDLEKFKRGPEYLHGYVSQRLPFIEGELQRLRRPAPLRLTSVNPIEGWVEVQNVSSSPVPLEGKTLTNNLRQALLKNLPVLTLAAGGTARFDMTALGVPLTPSGEVGLFSGERMTGVYDLLFYGPGSGGANVHYRDGQGRWQAR